ncbi:glutamate--cysteine ligase [Photobacterium alginatilyticum]|uniref:Glutamate--cysteine ligase n=1 Tax=Photobacterium alginatilyticum TaxID=1775171 RepID=A0ABW9YLB6_9GAMM|nr:glutamate--cysteine ligase [Photobacterium alginatilyticum]NBI54332.1 glutamate--cysteine ligase [Photobacterium alginatilyticum]
MDFSQRLQQISANPDALTQIGRGLEREALRMTPQGDLSAQPHPAGLGSALTNKWVTTDFAESLLEFITPVSHDVDSLLTQLSDIHQFTYSKLDQESLWPMSMPCFVGKEDDITLAQYGSSNSGRMKTLYREGLKHRYGSVMQVISGVHFNFSFPDEFWQQLFGDQAEQERRDSVSDAYFGLIRNYYRFGWLIPYLFGASPALCGSFLNKSASALNFEKVGCGTYFLPNATALRLSDLGYTNHEQSSLKIGFNSLDQYLEGLQKAIRTPSEEFASIGVKVDGEYRQLNTNVLQIENELYAPIRPKRVAADGEKPSEALSRGGVEYIEVRSLDVNPFSPIGITADQVRFLDLFLTWAVLSPSDQMDDAELECWRDNWNRVVLDGRNPELLLKIGCNGERLTVQKWGQRVFAELEQVALAMDAAAGNDSYQQTILRLKKWIDDPELTLSARLLNQIKQQEGIGRVGLELANAHAGEIKDRDFAFYSQQEFEQEVEASRIRQAQIEQNDSQSFDEFLDDYFADLK